MPDFVINAGGLINVFVETTGSYSKEVVLNKIDNVYNVLIEILNQSDKDKKIYQIRQLLLQIAKSIVNLAWMIVQGSCGLADKNIPPSSSSEKDPLSLFIQKAYQYLHQYFKYIVCFIALSLVIFGGVLLWQHWEKRQNQLAEEELYVARSALIAAEKKAKEKHLVRPHRIVFLIPYRKLRIHFEICKKA